MRVKNIHIAKQIEHLIDEYRERTGTSPSTYEMAHAIGVGQSTIVRYLADMREQGIIECTGHRGYVTKAAKKMKDNYILVPLLNSVSDSANTLEEYNVAEYVHLPVSLLGRGDYFILRANGNSIVESGIDNGDLVIVRRQERATSGQIVVILADNALTLTRFCKENDDPVKKCFAIQGVAVKVLKDLE